MIVRASLILTNDVCQAEKLMQQVTFQSLGDSTEIKIQGPGFTGSGRS